MLIESYTTHYNYGYLFDVRTIRLYYIFTEFYMLVLPM